MIPVKKREKNLGTTELLSPAVDVVLIFTT
jgi:hypothetical protein